MVFVVKKVSESHPSFLLALVCVIMSPFISLHFLVHCSMDCNLPGGMGTSACYFNWKLPVISMGGCMAPY